MKRALWAVPLLVVVAVWFARGAYSYYYTENGASPVWANWIVQNYNGQLAVYSNGGFGGIAFNSYGGSGRMTYPSTTASPGEVKLTYRMATTTFPGSATVYLSASTDLSAPGAPSAGSGYKIDFQFGSTGSSYSLSRIDSGQFTVVSSGGFGPGHDLMTFRFVRNSTGVILGYVDNVRFLQYSDTTYTSGRMAVELGFDSYQPASGPLLSEIDLGNLDSIAPGAIPSGSISATPFYNHVDIQWPAASDDANGTGIYDYEIYRNGWLVGSTSDLSFSDSTVAPSTTYTYTLKPVDFHGNAAATDFVVTTPAFSPEGRRVGVRTTGAYWGATGENIDVLSGNLNYTLPLINAKARNGWSVGFNLNYNSQDWRYDANRTWKYGADVGYGFGWRLMAGSITPKFADAYSVNYYLFTDSTGAEYRLDQNSGNVWSSKESVYVYYDAAASTLHFRDGSFWYFGCTSAISEADSGVMYPTLMEDANGNQIIVHYKTGLGATWADSSARINTIQDVRTPGTNTYVFNYNADSPPHLTGMNVYVPTGENYTFNYSPNQSLSSPFDSTSYGTVTMLQSVVVIANNTDQEFTYNAFGELTQVVLPYKGYLAYDYSTTTYANNLSYREVVHRRLSKDGVSSTQYPFAHELTPSANIHQFTQLDDPGGVGEKYWAFATSGANAGLVTQYEGRQMPGQVAKIRNDYTWVQDSVGNYYIGTALVTADPGQSYAAQKKTTQSVDTHGNVTQVNTFDYGNLSTPIRTDNFTYQTGSGYASRYIFNRLATSPTTTVTYDEFGLTSLSGILDWDTSMSGITLRGNPTTITSPAGTQTMHYDVAGGVTSTTSNGVTTSLTSTGTTNYAAPSQITVGGFSTSLTYNSFLGLTNETDPNGAQMTIGYDVVARPSSTTSPFGATTTNTYSDTSNPPTVTSAVNGRWTRNSMDGLGRTIKTETGNASGTVSVAETQYDSCGCSPTGKVKQTALPHAPGATPVWTTYTYDGIGRTLTSTTAGTDTTGTTNYLYQGNTVTVTDAAGHWKKYTMNALGQLVQVNEPNPSSSGGGSSTNYALSLNGAVASASSQYSSSYPVSSINDGDELGSNWGNSGGWNDAAGPPSWVEIDFAGQKTINEIDVYTLADCFPNCASITPSQTATSYGISDFQVQYDSAGSWQTVSGGSISSNTLAWNKLTFSSVTTGKIRVNITAAHGGFSRLVELEAWGSGGGNGSEYFTNYSYDSLGHLTGVSMPRSTGTQTRTFNYGNPPGAQLLSATNPENGTVSYTYNSDHTLATKTDAKSQQVQYSYDSYKRVTQIRRGTYTGGTFTEDTCQQENYYYDSGQYGLGRLTSMQYKGGLAYAFGNPSCDHTFTETFTYNSPGGMTSQSLGVSEPAQNYSQGGNISMALTANYTYDNEGRMTATQYPSAWNGSSWVSGPNLGNTFDGMGRLQKLTDLTASSDIIANATYAPTGQLLTMTGASGAPNETRTYNSIGQMTRLQSGSLDIQYAYPTTQNNGKISSQYDNVSGEQITYMYDSLNRLASATGSGWGQSYNYDGFGNLTDQNVTSGTAPALHVTYDPATNRQTGECADANGNLCGSYYSYDVENRFVRKGASWSVTPDVAYSYRPGNKRVWKGTNYVVNDQNWSLPSTDEVTFWSITGQKLATYNLSQYQPGGYYTQPQLVATQTGTNYYFGGKLVKNSTGYVTPDRLGSIGKYFPYGQERPSATQDGKEKFATYFRDSETGLDYANNRYHQPGMGRFITPDSVPASSKDPTSWNRYSYVEGDPINYFDPRGRYQQAPGTPGADDGGGPDPGNCEPSGVNCYPGEDPAFCYYNPNDPECYHPPTDSAGGGGGGGDPVPSVDPNCDRADWLGAQRFVYSTIKGDIDALGIKVAGFTFDMQMAGGHNPGAPSRRADMTELVLRGDAGAYNDLVASICTTVGDPKCFSNAGWDPFHSGMNYRQNVADNSMQITGGFDSQSGQYVINIDIDPHNPSFGPLSGRLGHGWNVIANGFTGGDTNYHNVAAGLSARGIGGGCP
ncbi:MAG TPA: RHS repeat-associated core domain-containing protein [Bryobacteraceae bacterium]|jgi:RHS repeat-associated protein|nr:RHS repeat-associated core domain-containing protein [Bryobacteraceae bacterium]